MIITVFYFQEKKIVIWNYYINQKFIKEIHKGIRKQPWVGL